MSHHLIAWRRRQRAAALRRERLQLARAIATHTDAEWAAVREHFGACVACGDADAFLAKDHVRSISMGGCDGAANLQPLCWTCNSSKGSESMDFRPRGVTRSGVMMCRKKGGCSCV